MDGQATRALTLAVVALTLVHAGCIHKGDTRPDPPAATPPAKPAVPPPKPGTPPTRVIACWNKNVEWGTDPVSQQTIAGIAGRIYLLDETATYAIPGDGTLSVELYDDSGRAEGKPSKKLEVWNIDPETLKKLVKKDMMGAGYTLSLPWSTYRKDISQIHMVVNFQPPTGAAITSTGAPLTVDHSQAPQITHTMPGPPSPLAAVSAPAN
jgi:hypothetical protein